MADAARTVQERLRNRLASHYLSYEWTTEFDVGGTPVDVAGVDSDLVLLELEWRRADPVDNTAKLFRHLADGTLDAYGRVTVVQLFTAYYDLARGGVSSKRRNAEFVGERVASSFDRVRYRGTTLPIDPPKRGGSLPDAWRDVVDETVDSLLLDDS